MFTDPDTVRDVIHNFNRDGFDALYPRYGGGRPQTFTLPKRQEIKRIALTRSRPTSSGRLRPGAWPSWPTTWSPRGWSRTSPTKGCGQLLREEGVCFQAVRTWKRSNDPNFEAKTDRIVELYALAEAGEAVVICLDEFGPLNLQPQPGGKGWAPRSQAADGSARPTPARTASATMLGAYDVGHDRLYGHIKKRKGRVEFLAFCRYIRSLYPPEIRLHFVLDNFSPHKGDQVRDVGRGQQRRAGLHAVLRLLAEPHRGAVPRAALLHPRRHRPPRPRHPGPTDPPLHRLAQPQHRQTRGYARVVNTANVA